MNRRELAALDAMEALNECREWALEQFPKESIQSLANHLAEEAQELAAAPADPHEIADVAMLLYGIIVRSGVDLATALREKLVINKAREWGETGPDGVTHHV